MPESELKEPLLPSSKIGRRANALASGGALLLLLFVSSIFAASDHDYDDCAQQVDRDRQAFGCTRIIEDIGESQHNRKLAYFNRGLAQHAKGNADSAIDDYTMVLKLDPEDAAAYDNRGIVWRDKHHFSRAIADFNQAIRLRPDNFVAYNNRATAYREQKYDDRAIKDYSMAISIKPDYAAAYSGRAQVWLARGQNDRAVVDLSEAIRLDPGDASNFRLRGYTRFGQGNFSASAEDLLLANQIAADPAAMLWRYLSLGHLREDGKIELADSAARLSSYDWPYAIIKFYLSGDKIKYDRLYARNLSRDCETLFYVGEWQLINHDVKAAIGNLSRASNICPENSREAVAAIASLNWQKQQKTGKK